MENLIIKPAVQLQQNDDIIYILKGIIVDIITDKTDFEECYLSREVISVNEDEIEIEDGNIPWEYIKEISIISR